MSFSTTGPDKDGWHFDGTHPKYGVVLERAKKANETLHIMRDPTTNRYALIRPHGLANWSKHYTLIATVEFKPVVTRHRK